MTVEDDTFYAMDPTQPCTVADDGSATAHANNPMGSGAAEDKGCMVGAPHTSKWAKMAASFWSKIAMRGAPFDAISRETATCAPAHPRGPTHAPTPNKERAGS